MEKTEMRDLLGVECKANGDPCYVARINREFGITLKSMETDEDAFCLNRKQILDFMTCKDKVRQYHEMFSATVKMIKAGSVDAIVTSRTGWKVRKFSSIARIMARCAF